MQLVYTKPKFFRPDEITRLENLKCLDMLTYYTGLELTETEGRQPFYCDRWTLIFHAWDSAKDLVRVNYSTGLGHRRQKLLTDIHGNAYGGWFVPPTPGFPVKGSWEKDYVPTSPKVEDVIYRLWADASLVNDTLEDFISNSGCDNAYKGFELYKACMESKKKLHKILHREVIAKLPEFFENY